MTPEIGHNTGVAPEAPAISFAKDQLRTIIERIEYIEVSIKERNADRADIYTEAKSGGFDVKALRTIVRMRKQDANERVNQDAILDIYKDALGMLA